MRTMYMPAATCLPAVVRPFQVSSVILSDAGFTVRDHTRLPCRSTMLMVSRSVAAATEAGMRYVYGVPSMRIAKAPGSRAVGAWTEFEAADGALVPAEFVAVTRKV